MESCHFIRLGKALELAQCKIKADRKVVSVAILELIMY